MVNCWNEWDPLKRVIVGMPDGTQVVAPEPGRATHDQSKLGFPLGTYGKYPQKMVDEANEQMDYFIKVMEDRGIIVDRVEPPQNMMEVTAFSTPDWTQLNPRGYNNPRDLFLPIGNEIMEGPVYVRSRWYEYLMMRPIFERYFKEDPEFLWTAAPKPRLKDDFYDKMYFHNVENVWTLEELRQRLKEWKFRVTEQEPIWDSACASRCGKDQFWTAGAAVNRAGMNWLRRYLGTRGIRVHPITFMPLESLEPDVQRRSMQPGHIDVLLCALRPGLSMFNPDRVVFTKEANELFKMNDWELLPAERPQHIYPPFYHAKPSPSWISMNTFSLGPDTVCVEAHEENYTRQLEKLGFDVIPVPYDKVVPFGGGLHCTTLDVYREGKLEDYFPKQIPGY